MTATEPFGIDRPDIPELDDSALVELARNGVHAAYATLYDRHAYSAHRLARHLGMRDEAEDIVSESFAQVLELMQRGKGPQTAFRAYLFTTIRNGAARRAKARQKLIPTDDYSQIDTLVGFDVGRLDAFELSAIRAAYDSLPERWRTVLWQVEVERRRPQELTSDLGLSANGVSALAYRARAALREAYLKQHIGPVSSLSSSCRDAQDDLPAMVRGTLPERREERLRTHLRGCADCSSILLELQDANHAVGGTVRAG
jgi:RNA polymerase sigma factor (sigma-70 family)